MGHVWCNLVSCGTIILLKQVSLVVIAVKDVVVCLPLRTSVLSPTSERCESSGRLRLLTKASVKVGRTGWSSDFVTPRFNSPIVQIMLAWDGKKGFENLGRDRDITTKIESRWSWDCFEKIKIEYFETKTFLWNWALPWFHSTSFWVPGRVELSKNSISPLFSRNKCRPILVQGLRHGFWHS